MTAQQADVLATYSHPVWKDYAAVTRNHFGKGSATYVATMPTDAQIDAILSSAAATAGLTRSENRFPVVEKNAVNQKGKALRFLFNYSENTVSATISGIEGKELLSGEAIANQKTLSLAPWGVAIIEVTH